MYVNVWKGRPASIPIMTHVNEDIVKYFGVTLENLTVLEIFLLLAGVSIDSLLSAAIMLLFRFKSRESF